MVIANIARKSGPFVADGINPTFPYDFRVFTASQIRAYQDMTLVNAALFSVTGVNGPSGSVVFNTAPAAGVIVWIFGETDKEQPTSYPPSDPFPALSHETAMDRAIMILWELDEQLERTLKFDQSALNAQRNRVLPPPLPLGHFLWDATGLDVVYALEGNGSIPTLPGEGARLIRERTQIVNTVAGATVLSTAGLVPPGTSLLEGMAFVSTAPGTSNGLQSWSLGTVSAFQRYARFKAITASTVTNAGEAISKVEEPAPAGLELVITADAGGPFDAVGQFIVTASYVLYNVPTAVP